MSIETALQTLLVGLCPRVFPDVAPFSTPTPYVTWQQVGGDAPSFVENTVPSTRNALVQINVWSTTRLECTTLALQIEAALIASAALAARPDGAMVSTHDTDTGRRGTRQDFTIWADR